MAGLVEGKSALITGGGSGIGRESALLLAAEGASVFVADLHRESAEETAQLISDRGGHALARGVDVTDEAQVEAMVMDCQRELGALDAALNNAGTSGAPSPVDQTSRADFERTVGVNLTGVFLCMKYEIPAMRAAGKGSIVNMASGSGWIGTPGLAPYCASKHGVLGLTKTAALENAQQGVRINAICPGSIDTPMLRAAMAAGEGVEKMVRASMPIGRFGEPEEVAEAVVWLCSDRASLVTGASIGVDGAAVAR